MYRVAAGILFDGAVRAEDDDSFENKLVENCENFFFGGNRRSDRHDLFRWAAVLPGRVVYFLAGGDFSIQGGAKWVSLANAAPPTNGLPRPAQVRVPRAITTTTFPWNKPTVKDWVAYGMASSGMGTSVISVQGLPPQVWCSPSLTYIGYRSLHQPAALTSIKCLPSPCQALFLYLSLYSLT